VLRPPRLQPAIDRIFRLHVINVSPGGQTFPFAEFGVMFAYWPVALQCAGSDTTHHARTITISEVSLPALDDWQYGSV